MGLTAEFHFDADKHEYTGSAGDVLPHVTGMLEASGWIDDRWWKEEHSIRGQAVHKLTADFDLGALDPKSCTSHYKGWLLGHVKCMGIVRPEVIDVEVPRVHPTLRFGGRPDRILRVYRQLAIWEIKSGAKDKSHQIQTALQAILASADYGLPPDAWMRYCEYVQANGKFKVEPNDNPADFAEAYKVIKDCCR